MKKSIKATFKAKIIVETSKYFQNWKLKQTSYSMLRKMIKSGKYKIEFISQCLSQDCEPTIIIKDK